MTEPGKLLPPPSRVSRSKHTAMDTYDRLSGWYDWLAASEARFGALGVRLLAARENEWVLEIGTGTGRNALALARQVGPNGRVAGVDLSNGMIREAQTKICRAGLERQVILLQGDAAELPCQPACFDAAFAAFTLELFDTPEILQVLVELRRVLRSGGRVCVVSLAAVESPGWPVLLYEWFHQHFPAWVDCRPIPTAEYLTQSGFVIRERQQGSLWGLRVDLVLATI